MKYIAIAATLLAAASCAKKKDTRAETSGQAHNPAATATPTVSVPPTTPAGMVWVEEDYDKALALARERKVPLVIDAWAAWCHTCMDMHKHVLTEKALGEVSSQFIWLRIDQERPENAPVIARFPILVSPTYYIVDSTDESVLGRQLGGSSSEQFKRFLTNTLAGIRIQEAPRNRAEQLLLQGNQSAAAGEVNQAGQHFREARIAADKDWPRLPELLLAQVNLLHMEHKYQECATLALEALPLSTKSVAPLGLLAFEAEMCARNAKRPLAKQVRTAIVRAVDSCLDGRKGGGMLERSEALQMKRYALQALGKEAEAIATADEEIANMEAAARSAESPRDAMPYQIVAVEVHAFLGTQGEFIPVLERAVEALPLEYHIKFLLGQLYYLEERYDDAQLKAERALELSYGPQRGIVHSFLAEVYWAQGDKKKEEDARNAVVAFYQSLPPGQRRAAELEAAREALTNITGN